jgi:pre-mRNA-splicing helicase BRR2
MILCAKSLTCMAEKKRIDYSYAANSNLVLSADRSLIGRRADEPTGEAESLWGKVNLKQLGDRARPDPVSKKRKGSESTDKKKKKSSTSFSNILNATQDFEHLDYQPKTKQTQETYELILVFLSKYLGDIQQDVLVSAADAVIAVLKDENLKDFDRQKEIEQIISSKIPSENFAQLVNLGKKIFDYGNDGQGAKGDGDEYGVAVVFDEEEDNDPYEIDDSEEEDEGGDEADINTVFLILLMIRFSSLKIKPLKMKSKMNKRMISIPCCQPERPRPQIQVNL